MSAFHQSEPLLVDEAQARLVERYAPKQFARGPVVSKVIAGEVREYIAMYPSSRAMRRAATRGLLGVHDGPYSGRGGRTHG